MTNPQPSDEPTTNFAVVQQPPALVPHAPGQPYEEPYEPSRGKALLIAGSVAVAVASLVSAVVLFWPDSRSPNADASGTDDQVAAADTASSPAEEGAGGVGAAPSASGASAAPGRTTSPTPGSGATFADEFSGTKPDPGKWTVYSATSKNGSLWKPEAVTVGGGELRIAGTGKNPTGSGNVAGGLCWCGTGGVQVYGTWQVRARVDAGAGYGPVIGLWPDSGNPNEDGFMSFARFTQPDRKTVRSVTMWKGGGKSEGQLAGDFTGWHTYTVHWRAGSLKVLVDDKVLYDSTGKPGVVIPSKPMHLIIQQMVGPNEDVAGANATTPAQVNIRVDWVRYFR